MSHNNYQKIPDLPLKFIRKTVRLPIVVMADL